MSIHRSSTRVIYLLIWFGAFLSLMAYGQTARIGTGLFIILGGIVIMLLAILGIVFALHEELGKQGSSQKEADPICLDEAPDIALYEKVLLDACLPSHNIK